MTPNTFLFAEAKKATINTEGSSRIKNDIKSKATKRKKRKKKKRRISKFVELPEGYGNYNATRFINENMKKTGFPKNRGQALIVRNLVDHDTCNHIHQLLNKVQMNTGPDSVDQLPMYQIDIYKSYATYDVNQHPLLQYGDQIAQQVNNATKVLFDMDDKVNWMFARRYKPEERTNNIPHVDSANISVIVQLTDPSECNGYHLYSVNDLPQKTLNSWTVERKKKFVNDMIAANDMEEYYVKLQKGSFLIFYFFIFFDKTIFFFFLKKNQII